MPMTVVVRTHTDPNSLIEAVRGTVRSLDKNLPVYDVRTLQQYLAISVAEPRFNAMLLGIFAALSLILAAVGLYGVISYGVARRTHEIGVRMALGATRGDVLGEIVKQGLRLVLLGTAIGLAVALATTQNLKNMLFGVQPADPVTLIAVSLLLVAVATLASYIPARRATKVDPMVALRYE